MTFLTTQFRPMAFFMAFVIGVGSQGIFPSPSSAAPLGANIMMMAHDTDMSESRLPHPLPPSTPTHISVQTVSDLSRLFSHANYSLEDISTGTGHVPGIFLFRLPGDLAEIDDPSTLKTVFIQALLPLVLKTNQSLHDDRMRLLTLRDSVKRGEPLQFLEAAWLERISNEYNVGATTLTLDEQISELMLRVDEIPPSLVLAQAIEESGWGTSRLARKGNSLFGHTVFPASGPKIRVFDSLGDGVNAYFRNLNTHSAYRAFRQDRAAMRRAGSQLDSYQLIEKLTSYSTRKKAYISTLRTLIRSNSLTDYDNAQLKPAHIAAKTPEPQFSVAFP